MGLKTIKLTGREDIQGFRVVSVTTVPETRFRPRVNEGRIGILFRRPYKRPNSRNSKLRIVLKSKVNLFKLLLLSSNKRHNEYISIQLT